MLRCHKHLNGNTVSRNIIIRSLTIKQYSTAITQLNVKSAVVSAVFYSTKWWILAYNQGRIS